jgi:hypothetical protein
VERRARDEPEGNGSVMTGVSRVSRPSCDVGIIVIVTRAISSLTQGRCCLPRLVLWSDSEACCVIKCTSTRAALNMPIPRQTTPQQCGLALKRTKGGKLCRYMHHAITVHITSHHTSSSERHITRALF